MITCLHQSQGTKKFNASAAFDSHLCFTLLLILYTTHVRDPDSWRIYFFSSLFKDEKFDQKSQ